MLLSKSRLGKLIGAILILLLIDVVATVAFNAISGTGNLMNGLWALLVIEGLIMMAICLALLTSHSRGMRTESLYPSSIDRDTDSSSSYKGFNSDEMIAILFGSIGFIFVFMGTVIAG